MDTPKHKDFNHEKKPKLILPPEPEGYVWKGNPYLMVAAPRTMWRQSPRLDQYTDGVRGSDNSSSQTKSNRLHVLLSGSRDEAWLYEDYMKKFKAMKEKHDAEYSGNMDADDKMRTYPYVNRESIGEAMMLWDEFPETNSSAECFNYEMNKEEFTVYVSRMKNSTDNFTSISNDNLLNVAMSANISNQHSEIKDHNQNRFTYSPEILDAVVAPQQHPPTPPISPPSKNESTNGNSNNSSYWKTKHIINCT